MKLSLSLGLALSALPVIVAFCCDGRCEKDWEGDCVTCYFCRDGTCGTPCCATASCNIFCCACGGGTWGFQLVESHIRKLSLLIIPLQTIVCRGSRAFDLEADADDDPSDVFALADTSGTGKLTLDQYLVYMEAGQNATVWVDYFNSWVRISLLPQIREYLTIFRFDKNGDGMITIDEVSKWSAFLGCAISQRGKLLRLKGHVKCDNRDSSLAQTSSVSLFV